MRIFELLNPQAQQKLSALDQGQNPGEDAQGKFDASQVDANLQDIAQGANDQNAQPDLPQGAETPPPELDNQNTKPLDDALLGQLKKLPYNRYPVDDKSPISVMNIAQMELDDLSSLKNQVIFKSQMTSMKDKVGLDENEDLEFYNDLLKVINTVMQFKTSNTKAQLAQTNPTPSYQTMKSSK